MTPKSASLVLVIVIIYAMLGILFEKEPVSVKYIQKPTPQVNEEWDTNWKSSIEPIESIKKK
jgi:hypothetical protein